MIFLEGKASTSFCGEYVCRNDIQLTLESDVAQLSEMFGYTTEEMKEICGNGLVGLIRSDFQSAFRQRLAAQLESGKQVELFFPVRHKSGAEKWVMNRGCLAKGADGQEYLCGLLVEMTRTKQKYDSEKEMASELQEQAKLDSLTKILNANAARKAAEEYLCGCKMDKKCALLIVDLDNFKQINDRNGHLFGDAVLVQAAQKIRKLFRSGDIVGRIGGDEFMILMKDISDKEIVKLRCMQLNASLQEIFAGQDTDCKPTCSIGVAFLPEHGNTYFQLFCCADRALYYAKDMGRKQYAFYDAADCGPIKDKCALQFSNYDESMLRGYIE